eukprot:CAMPEP_0114684276 /NCGR_PEP_ID=MMETSP0191-20121206/58903_1 /TAXON_ID=126664 /ORGANISM="Sorites sp." /LENGTH=64 /DNA_ID=CAMNT_0001966771 /DNA_START=535 /DNA_END=729 /DNA_ORIENTATION=+
MNRSSIEAGLKAAMQTTKNGENKGNKRRSRNEIGSDTINEIWDSPPIPSRTNTDTDPDGEIHPL